MELEITDKKDNPLLNRTEIRFKVTHEAASTPARKDVREALAKKVGATKDRVVVDHLDSFFGKCETEGYAKVYKTKNDAMRIEPEATKKKHGLVEPKKEKGEKKKKEAEAPGEKKE